MLMRVLAIESAVSPESLTCAMEETFVQADQQHENNAYMMYVTKYAHARHALISRSRQPGLVTKV
jgi:hypothetical protein